MNEHASPPRPDAGRENRRFERQRVPLKAKIVQLDGGGGSDCTIVDLSLVGAQITLADPNPVPERFFVIELKNRIAYDAKVAWWRPNAAGLAFQQSYQLDGELPAQVEFLKERFVEAKLDEVDILLSEGHALVDAVTMAGISGATYARLKAERRKTADLIERLWELEMENAALRKMLRPAASPETRRTA